MDPLLGRQATPDLDGTDGTNGTDGESIALRFCWHDIGHVVLDSAGKLVFPQAPAGPGVYHLQVDAGEASVYVGEANDLRRRFTQYRNPGPSQQINQRLRGLVTRVLSDGRRCRVSVAAEISFDVQSRAAGLNLRLKAARLLVESAAIVLARHDGARTVLNLIRRSPGSSAVTDAEAAMWRWRGWPLPI